MLLALGCGDAATSGDATADEIADALELENGGLTMEDEEPAFGEPESFDGIAEYEAIQDAFEEDPDVTAMRELPDAVQVDLIVEWGQIPGNLS